MTGEQLYTIWYDEMVEQGVIPEAWEHIGDEAQEAWQKLALLFNESA